jgi:glycerol kinase
MSHPPAVIAIDQGTTSTRVIAFASEDFSVLSTHQQEFTQYFPLAGQVEHDLNEIWPKTKECLEKVMHDLITMKRIVACIGITNQRETIGFWDKKSGEPITRALVWQDRRTTEFCKTHFQEFQNQFRPLTGLPLDPYFSGPKIRWLLENNESVKRFIHKSPNDLMIGTIDSYLVYKLTNGTSFVTDPTNASRTQLLALNDKSWHQGLCDFFKVKKSWLPEIKDSLGEFGFTQNVSKLIPNNIPITAIIGDQQSSLFAQGCIQAGELKCTYGTGAFLLAHTGEEAKLSQHGLLTTTALQYQGKRYFAFEGASFIAGAAVQWLRDGLKLIAKSSDIESLANQSQLKDADTKSLMSGLYFLPFFTGMGAPRWISEAKGTIWGIERGTTNTHIARACLEGICLAIDDLVTSMEQDLGRSITEIKVDGGATRNFLLMEIQSSFSQKPVTIPKNIESTALGAAAGAWIALNKLPLSAVKQLNPASKIVYSTSDPALELYYQSKRKGWKNLLDRLYK